jgi:predicted GNAT family acetyltransferase/uncharacterized Fe-S cluster protein YjdI
MANKEYSTGEITILWQPEKCIHAGICVKTLPNVYNPKEKPWIKPKNASPEELINQVAKCPSGALSMKQDYQMQIRIEREDNGRKGRFVVYVNDEFAGEMTYVWAGTSKFIIDHTGVEESFGGKGLGRQLVMKAVEYARNNALKILPLCPFAKKVFDKETGIGDVRA